MRNQFTATTHEAIELDSDTIRDLRTEAGLTQVELAERLGVNPNTIAHWENGRAHPGSASRAIDIVETLDADPEPSEDLKLLPLSAWTVGGRWAAIKQRGRPPIVFRTVRGVEKVAIADLEP